MENKIDLASFEALVRAVEMKPDRHELGHVLPSSYRGGSNQGIEVDRSVQYEMEKRIQDIEKSMQLATRDIAMQTEQIKSLVNLNLTQKADFRDVDNLSHGLSQKADVGKVQELVTAIRNELVNAVSSLKKELSGKAKKNQSEQRLELDKLHEEQKANRDKI